MIFYRFNATAKWIGKSEEMNLPLPDDKSVDGKEPGLAEWNLQLYQWTEGKRFKAYITRNRKDHYEGYALTENLRDGAEEICREVTSFFAAQMQVELSFSSIEEIVSDTLHKMVRLASHHQVIADYMLDQFKEDKRIDYMDDIQRGRTYCNVKEELLDTAPAMSLEQALCEAETIMADETVRDELKRIYSDLNIRAFYGHPVHYKVTAADQDNAMEIVHLLMHALYTNKRLPSNRLTSLSSINDTCYDEYGMDSLFLNSSGSCIAIEMRGDDPDENFASSYQEVVKYFVDCIDSHHRDTLFFLIETPSCPGFSESLIHKLNENIELISLTTGSAKSREEALQYLNKLAVRGNLNPSQFHLQNALPDQPVYTSQEVLESYQRWEKKVLKQEIYKAYQNTVEVKVKKQKAGTAYEELQSMIGLTDAKKMVDDMIAYYTVQQLRTKKGMKTSMPVRHMCFTGNPGTAKTSVARLIARILKENGILETGAYVECGRQDLIAKYVGWTAKNVSQQFRKANGGVLFIDEAYSLVDGSNSFGDEAINTIVQEMENQRDKVIVIFAGYPDKMQRFLDKNEGLRSRIAFHMHFPDYDQDELVKILQLMAKENGYTIRKTALEKCATILGNACRQKDYGNGRYVRNVLEQAMQHQSRRLMKIRQIDLDHEFSRTELRTLVPDDFSPAETGNNAGLTAHRFGFLCG